MWSSCKNILFDFFGVPSLCRCELYHLMLVHVNCIKYIPIDHLILLELKDMYVIVPCACIFDASALLFDVAVFRQQSNNWEPVPFKALVWSLLKTEVWLGLITMTSNWWRRKTRHEGFASSICGKFSSLWLM
jgi:hypothetical protein